MVIKHFPYIHPIFGTKKKPNQDGWKRSVYYWWWEYLKRNKDYMRTCQMNGKGTCEALYKDFGNIHKYDFQTWWTKEDRGATLFANRNARESIVIVDNLTTLEKKDGDLLLKINLNIPKKQIQSKFNAVLSKHHKGKRGYQDAKIIDALYKFNGQPNVKALELALKIYDLKIENPKLTLWELSELLPKFQPTNKINRNDTKYEIIDKKNRLSASIARYLSRAQKSINNTGHGIFP